MLDQTTKRKLDSARQILVGKVPDPKAQVEQITTALIYKFMDDMDKENEEVGLKTQFFIGDFQKFSWTKLLDNKLSGQERLDLYVQAITNMPKNPHIPQLFRNIFKGAFLPYNDPRTLSLFLKEINEFNYENSENLGNAFEYLLSIFGSQGDAGMFRTPRHIIDFIVEVVYPKKNEKILDPACGTAGFLISAYKHILACHSREGGNPELTPDEKLKLMNNIAGYDISPDMVKLALVNMYLHGFPEPKIHEYDTLSSEKRWDETFDVILANPPFMTPKGGIVPHKRFSIQANRAEVLFVDYIVEHLTIKGRSGIIVPEGIIFQSNNAYKQLRKKLVENGLFAIVSLPAGVFNPYAGVKTSILFFDNEIYKKTKNFLFLKIQNDGFDLGAQRREHNKNDLPLALEIIKKYKQALNDGKDFEFNEVEKQIAHLVFKEKIIAAGDYNLSGDRYKESVDLISQKWPMVELGDICEINPKKSEVKEKDIEVSFVPMIDVSEQNYYFEPKQTKKIDDVYKGYTYFAENDVLLAKITPCFENGKAAIARKLKNGIGFGSTEFIIFRAKDKTIPEWIYNFVANTQFINEGKNHMTGSAGQRRLNIDFVRNYKIPLPPLEVQKEIVEQIEVKQNAIDHAKAIIQNLERERRYFGQSLRKLDCKSVNMEEIFEKVNEQINPQNEVGKIVYVGLENIESNSGNLVGEVNAEMKSIKSTKMVFKKGDILYGKLRPNLNKVWFSDREGICSTDIFVLRSKTDSINPELYSLILRNDEFNTEVLKGLKGSQLPRIGFDYFASLKIPFLSSEIQEKLLGDMKKEQEIINANKQLIEIYEQKIENVLSEI